MQASARDRERVGLQENGRESRGRGRGADAGIKGEG